MSDDLREPDEYEAEYMSRDGDVVHREKLTFPPWFTAFITLSIGLGLGLGAWGSYTSGDMAGLAIMAGMMPVMAFIMMMASTLRVAVTKDHVTIQSGPLGPKIPIEKIELCEAENYQLWKYGGYGIRYSVIEGAWCYNMVGDKGKAVRIHYRTDSGALKKVLVASAHHHALADSINRMRVAKGHDVGELAPADEELGIDGEVVFSSEVQVSETSEERVAEGETVGDRDR
mgnify:CR=1 FL=1